ncbi:MAG TPA: helix-turn-helix domain-containing protein [Anaerovoracaceae bacterium]|nr:helix-turn-helix domain-containing protein [Anaerovoracaceae bacterium]
MLNIQSEELLDGVLTVEEVEEILRISRTKAYEFVNSGVFPVKKIGRTIRVPKKSFYEWLNAN